MFICVIRIYQQHIRRIMVHIFLRKCLQPIWLQSTFNNTNRSPSQCRASGMEFLSRIDRTFNLGSFFATTFVYKKQKVVRKETQEHPIFLGPVMLHKEADYTVYHSFFSHIWARLAVGITDIDVKIPKTMEFGSDAEKALTKAIDDCFPNADRKLCTKHPKDNLSDYLKTEQV